MSVVCPVCQLQRDNTNELLTHLTRHRKNDLLKVLMNNNDPKQTTNKGVKRLSKKSIPVNITKSSLRSSTKSNNRHQRNTRSNVIHHDSSYTDEETTTTSEESSSNSNYTLSSSFEKTMKSPKVELEEKKEVLALYDDLVLENMGKKKQKEVKKFNVIKLNDTLLVKIKTEDGEDIEVSCHINEIEDRTIKNEDIKIKKEPEDDKKMELISDEKLDSNSSSIADIVETLIILKKETEQKVSTLDDVLMLEVTDSDIESSVTADVVNLKKETVQEDKEITGDDILMLIASDSIGSDKKVDSSDAVMTDEPLASSSFLEVEHTDTAKSGLIIENATMTIEKNTSDVITGDNASDELGTQSIEAIETNALSTSCSTMESVVDEVSSDVLTSSEIADESAEEMQIEETQKAEELEVTDDNASDELGTKSIEAIETLSRSSSTTESVVDEVSSEIVASSEIADESAEEMQIEETQKAEELEVTDNNASDELGTKSIEAIETLSRSSSTTESVVDEVSSEIVASSEIADESAEEEMQIEETQKAEELEVIDDNASDELGTKSIETIEALSRSSSTTESVVDEVSSEIVASSEIADESAEKMQIEETQKAEELEVTGDNASDELGTKNIETLEHKIEALSRSCSMESVSEVSSEILTSKSEIAEKIPEQTQKLEVTGDEITPQVKLDEVPVKSINVDNEMAVSSIMKINKTSKSEIESSNKVQIDEINFQSKLPIAEHGYSLSVAKTGSIEDELNNNGETLNLIKVKSPTIVNSVSLNYKNDLESNIAMEVSNDVVEKSEDLVVTQTEPLNLVIAKPAQNAENKLDDQQIAAKDASNKQIIVPDTELNEIEIADIDETDMTSIEEDRLLNSPDPDMAEESVVATTEETAKISETATQNVVEKELEVYKRPNESSKHTNNNTDDDGFKAKRRKLESNKENISNSKENVTSLYREIAYKVDTKLPSKIMEKDKSPTTVLSPTKKMAWKKSFMNVNSKKKGTKRKLLFSQETASQTTPPTCDRCSNKKIIQLCFSHFKEIYTKHYLCIYCEKVFAAEQECRDHIWKHLSQDVIETVLDLQEDNLHSSRLSKFEMMRDSYLEGKKSAGCTDNEVNVEFYTFYLKYSADRGGHKS